MKTREEFHEQIGKLDASLEKFYGVPQPWLLPTDEFYALMARKENEILSENGH